MGEVIYANFSPTFFNLLNGDIHKHGVQPVYDGMVSLGWHQSFARCAIRKVLRMRGGIK